jgi:hypothetical protein
VPEAEMLAALMEEVANAEADLETATVSP